MPSTTDRIAAPYLLFVGAEESSAAAKTAFGLVRWRREACLGQLRLRESAVDLGLPDLSIGEARAQGVRTLIVGVANMGGYIDPAWIPSLVEAAAAGLDVASGLHARLRAIPELRDAADRAGTALHDVRHPKREFATATGAPRSGRRVLTVGSDCAVGKMFTALAVAEELRKRGHAADFRATGQTGILIAGSGVSVDAVVSDFVAGAAEWLTPAGPDSHWDVVEGQGSIHHPAYAGVTLALIHGSQPTALVLCHAAGRERLHGLARYPVPSLEQCLEDNLAAARLTSPDCFWAGCSVNTSALADDAALECLQELSRRLDLPCVDPVRGGVAALVDRLEESCN